MSVILVTLDGVRPDAIQQAHTPHLDRLMAGGAYTLNARSVMPSMTLPCHMSIFHSVPPQRHGTLSNDYHPSARPLPGLFEQVHEANLRGGIAYGWEPLRDLSRPLSLTWSYFHRLDLANLLTADMPIVAAAADVIVKRALDFLFVYIGATDEAGHFYQWMSDEYLRQVEIADGQVGVLLDVMTADDTMLVEADHGGHDRMHGTNSPEDMTIPWMVWGRGIRQGHLVEQPVTLLDTAPTVAALLPNVKPAPQWEGRVIAEIFA